MRGEKGFALVLTLVVTALMVAVLAEMVHQVYVDIALSRSFRDGQQASLLAESGINGGTSLLKLALQNKDYTSLSDAWATPVKLDDETGSIEVTITEESAKICINDLVQPTGELEPFTLAALKRLGERQNIPVYAWNSLADWMDSDDTPRTNGAETAYYRTLRPAYAAHNAKLTTFNELSLVREFTAERVAALRPFLTRVGQPKAPRSLVNINTASREVLTALDVTIDDRMAERIIEKRRLQPIKRIGDLSHIPGGGVVAGQLSGQVSFKGTHFKIISVARVKETARTVEVVLSMEDGTSNQLSWQEY